MAKSTSSNSSETVFLILGIVIFVALISLLFSYTSPGCSRFTKNELTSTANLILGPNMRGAENFKNSKEAVKNTAFFYNAIQYLLFTAFNGPGRYTSTSLLYNNFIKPYTINLNAPYYYYYYSQGEYKAAGPSLGNYYYIDTRCIFSGIDNADYINYLSKFTYASNLKDLTKLVMEMMWGSSELLSELPSEYFKNMANENTVILNSILRKTINYKEKVCDTDTLNLNVYTYYYYYIPNMSKMAPSKKKPGIAF